MKFLFAVLAMSLLWRSNVYASDLEETGKNILKNSISVLENTSYDTDKMLDETKKNLDELTTVIPDEVKKEFKEDLKKEIKDVSKGLEKEIKENSSEIIEKTTEGIKENFTESVKHYFSTMAVRIKDFLGGFF